MSTSKTKKPKTVSRTKIVEMVEQSKGRFFSLDYVNSKGEERTVACKSYAGTTKLGYILVVPVNKKDGKFKTIDPKNILGARIQNSTVKA